MDANAPLKAPTAVRPALAMTIDGLLMEASSIADH
jgi:hypothetical protein